MITFNSKVGINEFLIYKLFIKEYTSSTVFSIVQNDTESTILVKYLMEYPSSLRLMIRTDISNLYGNDFMLVAKNDNKIIYKEKLTIL